MLLFTFQAHSISKLPLFDNFLEEILKIQTADLSSIQQDTPLFREIAFLKDVLEAVSKVDDINPVCCV